VYRGAIGEVKLGIHKETGFKVAVKIFSKQQLNTDITGKKKVEKEIAIVLNTETPPQTSKYSSTL
jgi:serine/threonine protein kinase